MVAIDTYWPAKTFETRTRVHTQRGLKIAPSVSSRGKRVGMVGVTGFKPATPKSRMDRFSAASA